MDCARYYIRSGFIYAPKLNFLFAGYKEKFGDLSLA
jgi:hypothetical protein